MIHLSVVCCGRAIPLLWRVLEHGSATVAFKEYKPLLRKARWLLRHHPDVMLLGDRGFANHDLMSWLLSCSWHYCLRVPSDVHLHGIRRYPVEVACVYPKLGEAVFFRNLGLWQDGYHRRNLVVASPQGVKEPWAVIGTGLLTRGGCSWRTARSSTTLPFVSVCGIAPTPSLGLFPYPNWYEAEPNCVPVVVHQALAVILPPS